jgi:Predicted methyltransferase (contains TPR repeat)
MKNSSYESTLAGVYDKLNSELDIVAWADFLIDCVKKYSDTEVKHICELACGTGNMSIELAKRGYHLTSLDLSNDMLTVAEHKARETGADIRFSLQDMRNFSLYSKADLVICLLDSVNYLTGIADVKAMFAKVYDQLADGGLFLFDINSKNKFETVYDENSYLLEENGIFCAWQNFYHRKSKICDFYLTIFTQNKDGSYTRADEEQKEKMYSIKQITTALKENGFACCTFCSDFAFSPADENTCERIYFVAKKRVTKEDE